MELQCDDESSGGRAAGSSAEGALSTVCVCSSMHTVSMILERLLLSGCETTPGLPVKYFGEKPGL